MNSNVNNNSNNSISNNSNNNINNNSSNSQIYNEIINQIINVIKGEEEATSEVVKFDNVNQSKKLVSEAGSDIVLSPDVENDFSESLGSPGESVSSPTVGLPGGTTSDREYQTNIQEENVDEADIVKVNGDYIYYIPYCPKLLRNRLSVHPE